MDLNEIGQTIILGFPMFSGLILALYMKHEDNKQLIDILRGHMEHLQRVNEDCTGLRSRKSDP